MPHHSEPLSEIIGVLSSLLDELDYARTDLSEGETTSPAIEALERKVEEYFDKSSVKVDGYAHRLMWLDNAVAACGEESHALQLRAGKLKKDRKRLADLALSVMERNGWKKLEGVRSNLTKVEGRDSVCVDSVDEVPHQFKSASITVHVPSEAVSVLAQTLIGVVSGYGGSVAPAEYKVDKRSLKDALSVGEVAGASIEVGPPTLRAYIVARKTTSQEQVE